MTTLTVPISERQKEDLQERAKRLGIQLEELVRLSLNSLLSQDPGEFLTTMEYLLSKNEELYRRLS